MEPFLGVLMFVVVAGLVGVLAWWAHEQAKKRRLALSALASEMGLVFDPTRDRGHDERFWHFECFTRGHSRVAYNTMRGEVVIGGRPMEVTMGDYQYKTEEGSGKNRRTVTHTFSYLIFQLPFGGIPDLLIRREHFFDKIGSALGFDDIDFESAEFSKKYFVKSKDRKFAYDICHPRMIEFLLETGPGCVDIENTRLCMTDGSRVWEPGAFRYSVGWVDDFVSRWPGFVVKDLEEGAIGAGRVS